ncbi:MAG TPA: PIN domain-containing protein [Burkholderiales bacterium]|nr:PIN domain-containing protein [Burkholderiales bacterium]
MTAFFDTNVLVYLFDSASPEKQGRARDVFSERAQRDEVVLSTQVLQEFYVTVTRKLAPPLSADEAERLVRDFAAFPVVSTDAPLVGAAIALSRRHQLSLWDAMIVVAARAGGASELLTEDLQHGQVLEGVRIVNPFRAAAA